MSSIEPYTDCCDVTTYYAEAISTAKAYTSTGELVTSTSSATATSHVSYDDALETAQKIADTVAQSNADHDANVIDEAVTISNGNNDDVVVLENLSANDNNYEIQDNTDIIYIKGSVGNATNLPDQIFPLGNVTNLALNAGIYSLEKDNSGNIYAGGSFAYTSTAYIQLNGVGKWDGNVWNSLNNGFFYNSGVSILNPIVTSVKMDNKGNLYAGGLFTNAYDTSGTSLKNIAVWNGTNWSALGNNTNTNNGTSSQVNCLAIDSSNNVYVGGNFTTVTQSDGTTLTVMYIAKWNGTTWSSLGGGTTSTVNTLSIDSSDNVYVGGSFTSVTQNGSLLTVNNIAKWNGTTWSYLGSNSTTSNGVSGIVYSSIIDSSNNLIIGGNFLYANYNANGTGTTVNGIAKWNGSTWVTVGSNQGFLTNGGTVSTIYALEFDSSQNLVVGGYFQKLGDNSKLIYNIAKYDGTNWNSVGGGINNSTISSNTIRSLLLSDSNEIIMGSLNNILPYNTYFNGSSYISKISNNYVNLNYNDVRLITQYYEGQSTSIKTVKNNSSNKKVGFVYPNSYNITETYV